MRRDPKAVAIYSNRCATYIKLTEFMCALKDAEKCLEINPNFVKAYARKHPHSMGKWTADSKSHVSTMSSGDFKSNEKSITIQKAEQNVSNF